MDRLHLYALVCSNFQIKFFKIMVGSILEQIQGNEIMQRPVWENTHFQLPPSSTNVGRLKFLV